MEWNQLHYFQTVARLQHVTRAAEQLSISQPALSRSIAKLEEELGVPLFERQGRAIVLNRYGEILLHHVNRALQEIYDGQQKIQDLVDPRYGSVSLGFIHTLGTNLVPDLLGLYRQKYPQINFQLFQNGVSKILDQLQAAEIDFCLCSPNVTRGDIRWVKLFSEELFVVVPNDHRLAQRKQIKLKEIAADPFILVKKGYGLREITEQLCHEVGFMPIIRFEGEEVSTIAGLVGAKLGISLIPSIKGLDMSKISLLRVSEPNCQRDIGIAWIEGRYLSPAAKRFKQFVLDQFTM